MVQHSRSTELNRFILDINNSNNELCEWASQLAYGSSAEDAKVQSVWFHSATIHLPPFVGTATLCNDLLHQSLCTVDDLLIQHSKLMHTLILIGQHVPALVACSQISSSTCGWYYYIKDEIANHGRLILDRRNSWQHQMVRRCYFTSAVFYLI